MELTYITAWRCGELRDRLADTMRRNTMEATIGPVWAPIITEMRRGPLDWAALSLATEACHAVWEDLVA